MHERLLHHILGIGERARPLPGAPQSFQAEALKQMGPMFIFGKILDAGAAVMRLPCVTNGPAYLVARK
jgi:hypothetical protein